MIPLITNHSDQLAEICRRHHVKRLEVFGSAAVGDFNPEKSDIDFLVEFDDSDDLFPLPNPQRSDPRIGIPLQSFGRSGHLRQRRKPILPQYQSRAQGNRSLRHDPKTHILWDIQQAAQRIDSLTAVRPHSTNTTRSGEYPCWSNGLFIIIGEAMTRLETHHPDIASQITDYRDIIGFRIILVHRYPEIRNREIWEIIQHKLPTLLTEVTNLLNDN